MNKKQMWLVWILSLWTAGAFVFASYHYGEHPDRWKIQVELEEKLADMQMLAYSEHARANPSELRRTDPTRLVPLWSRESQNSIRVGKLNPDDLQKEITELERKEEEMYRTALWEFHVFPAKVTVGWGHEDVSRLLALIGPAFILAFPLWLTVRDKTPSV